LGDDEADGDDEQERAHGRSQSRIAAHFGRKEHKRLGRQHGEAAADQPGRAEIGDRQDEGKQRACRDRGGKQRERDGGKASRRGHAEAFGRLLQRGVDGAKPGGGQQEHVGEEFEAEHQNHAGGAINWWHRDAEARERVAHRPVGAEQHDPGIGADERRGAQADHRQGEDQPRAAQPVAGHEMGQADTEDGGADHAA